MNCPDDGLLQSYIDGELDIELRKKIERHLINCRKCSSVYKELKDCDDLIFKSISKYRQYTDDTIKTAKLKAVIIGKQKSLYDSIKDQSEKKPNKGELIMTSIYKYRKAVVKICAVLVIAACLSVQPVRAAISEVLTIFRVDKINGITISADDIQEIQEKLNNYDADIDMQKFGKVNTTGGERHKVTLSEAESFADFTVLQPSILPDSMSEITVIDPASMDFTLNADNMNQVLKSFGSEKLLPKSIDQKTFTIDISQRISMKYNIDGNDINIIQTRTPELIVPEGVDADEIYNSLIELPIIPDNLQRQLESIKDWKNTIYLPITGTDTIEVDINGLKGFAGTKTGNDGKIFSAIVWDDNGIIRTIEGNIGRDRIIEIARSMK